MPRYLPPSGVPITPRDILAGLRGACAPKVAVERFRDEVRRRFGVRHVFFASSGRAALSRLLSACQALNPEREEVMLPAYTSFSVPSAAVNAGLKVALYDLDPDSLSPDMASLEGALSPRTLAVVVCHLYGYPCHLGRIRELAAAHGIPVIDDAAQAMGAACDGKPAGTLGDAGLYSLSRGKNISTVDGGIIVTDNDRLAAVLSGRLLPPPGFCSSTALPVKAALLSLLLRPAFYLLPAKLPFLRLGASVFEPDFPQRSFTGFQAAIGSRMLARLDALNAGRSARGRSIMKECGSSGAFHFPTEAKGSVPVFLRLPVIRHGSRPGARPELGIVPSYPLSLDAIAALRPHLVNHGPFPGAHFLAERLLTVPTHQFVTDGDAERIVDYLRSGGG